MKIKKHKLGIHENYLVHRRINLSTVKQEKLHQLLGALNAEPGVDTVEFNPQHRLFSIAYDASTANVNQLLTLLKANDCVISQDWWNRTRIAWYRFTDENIHDNAVHTPWSCHQSPPTQRSKH